MNKRLESISVAFRAKVGAIWIRSQEENRVVREIAPIAEQQKYSLMVWSVTQGLRPFGNEEQSPEDKRRQAETKDPSAAIAALMTMGGRAIGIFADFSPWLNDPIARRVFIDAHRRITSLPKEQAKQIVVIDQNDSPQGVVGLTRVEWPLPDREDCGMILDSMLEYSAQEAVEDLRKNGNRDEVVNAMLGLTAEDAANALTRSIAATGKFTPKIVQAEKARLIKGGGLEWYEPDPRGLDAVGGLDALKVWLTERKEAFGPKAREYNLPAPKGVLLTGIPGGGKSLTAKAVSAAWQLPLLRLDIGALFGKYVGDSEKQAREALATVEAVAPCVLWIDEVEKAFAGSGGGGDTDGGTSQRVFGTFLTWMQERKPGIFLLATSNDVSKLPPEFLRSGRWDAMWFVDLPNESERADIVRVMTSRFPHCSGIERAEKIVEASDGHTGAEIEQAFSDALYVAFADGQREVTTDDVVKAAKALVPLSVTMKEKLNAMRDWAKGRARTATKTTSKEYAPSKGRRSIE